MRRGGGEADKCAFFLYPYIFEVPQNEFCEGFLLSSDT